MTHAIMDVLENPCVAQCIAKHIAKGTDKVSDRITSLLTFAALSNDARFHEAIEPEIRAAQCVHWMVDWADKLQYYSTSVRKETVIIIANRDIVKLRECIQNVDKVKIVFMKEMCDFVRRHKETVQKNDEVNQWFNNIFYNLISEQSERHLDFRDEGRLFLEEIFPLKAH